MPIPAPSFEPTQVMTLGSVRQMREGQFYTQPMVDFFNPPRTTPQFPQNLLRQTLNGGLGRVRRVALGDIATTDVPTALTSQSAGPQAAATVTMPSASIQVPHVMRAEISPATVAVGYTVATLSSLVSLYHGYRRNNSLGWGLMWGLMGAVFPLITPTVALAQGYAVHKGRR